MTTFKKLNSMPIPIDYVEDTFEHDYEPSFIWKDERYYLDEFVRCHDNPWFNDDDIPEYIHGFNVTFSVEPIYIELLSNEYVNVYEEINVKMTQNE